MLLEATVKQKNLSNVIAVLDDLDVSAPLLTQRKQLSEHKKVLHNRP